MIFFQTQHNFSSMPIDGFWSSKNEYWHWIFETKCILWIFLFYFFLILRIPNSKTSFSKHIQAKRPKLFRNQILLKTKRTLYNIFDNLNKISESLSLSQKKKKKWNNTVFPDFKTKKLRFCFPEFTFLMVIFI